jgi:hypothetical protein
MDCSLGFNGKSTARKQRTLRTLLTPQLALDTTDMFEGAPTGQPCELSVAAGTGAGDERSMSVQALWLQQSPSKPASSSDANSSAPSEPIFAGIKRSMEAAARYN